MHDRTKKLLYDVVASGVSVQEWCGGWQFDDYVSDRQLRGAVEREFRIIGEAMIRLGVTDLKIAARIPNLPRIVAFRNRIIHGYDIVDDAAVWGIVQSRLPALVTAAEALLRELGDDVAAPD